MLLYISSFRLMRSQSMFVRLVGQSRQARLSTYTCRYLNSGFFKYNLVFYWNLCKNIPWNNIVFIWFFRIMISRICVILNLVLWTSYSEAARILGVWPMPSLSHYSLGHKLLKELSIRGHNVTMISPYNPQENITNFTNIFLDDMVPTINGKLPLIKGVIIVDLIIFHSF